jgi:hypothetical protein
LLDELAKPRVAGPALDHAPTIAFRDYCIDWLADHGSTADAWLLSLHTENQGWLWFHHPKDLGYKASTGFVDLYVKVNGFGGDLEGLSAAIETRPLPDGFYPATDTSHNVVIRHDVPRTSPWAGLPVDLEPLHVALDACRRITEWFDEGGGDLLRVSPRS